MFSRAHLLIERDWERLKEDDPWVRNSSGITHFSPLFLPYDVKRSPILKF